MQIYTKLHKHTQRHANTYKDKQRHKYTMTYKDNKYTHRDIHITQIHTQRQPMTAEDSQRQQNTDKDK